MRIKKLDDFRWIAAALVVAIHTSPLESINGTADFLLTRVLARVAVPFFFMITGYFVLGAASSEHSFARVKKCLTRNGIWYLLLTLLYLPITLYQYISGAAELSAGGVLRDVFLEGTYYHLWYFPALLIGVLVVYGLLQLGDKAATVIITILYVIGLFGDSYAGIASQIPGVSAVYEGWYQISGYTRNGLFFAPMFLYLGYRLSKENENSKTSAGKLLRNAVICLIFMAGEGMVLHVNGIQKHDSMYFILPILMIYFFSYLLTERTDEKKSSFYQKGPMLVYFLHPLVILVLRAFVKVTKLQFFLTVSPLYYMCILLGSVILTWLCLWAVQKIPLKVRR